MEYLYRLLQIQPETKWQLARIKNFFYLKKLKKLIRKDIYNKKLFFNNIKDFCYFVDQSIISFNIEKPDGIERCKTISHNSKNFTFILNFKLEDTTLVTLIYTYQEPDRINAKVQISTGKIGGYDIYLYENKLDLYSHETIGTEAYKATIIDGAINYMYDTLIDLIDKIYIKYIRYNKETNNEKVKHEEIQDSERENTNFIG